jgi:uncharacterized membrane protein HdeD (DUF308 family)
VTALRKREEVEMFDELIRRWWIVAARGLVAVAFGVAAFFAPQTALAFLVSFFAVFAAADGLFTMGAGLSLNWLSLFLEGVAGGAVGLFTFFYPPVAQTAFAYLIVAWAFVTGGLELIGALRLRKVVNGPMVRGEWLLGASGVLSLLFGGLVAAQSDASGTTLAWVIGGYALVSGALLLALALNIRTWRPGVPAQAAA